MAKKKENVTEEIKVQESTVKAPVKKAAAKKVKESEAKTQSEADIENEEEVLAYFSKFMEVRKDVLKSMEGLRNEKLIKSNMETKVTLSLKDEYKDIANLKDDLKQLFIVAKVELVDDTTLEEYETSYIKVEKFNGVQCPRCWNYFDEDEMNGELCSRCASVAHRVAE